MLCFIGDRIVLGSNGSIPWDNRDEWAVGGQEGLHLATHGDDLTHDCVVRFNIFLACKTLLIQLEFLFRDATGL